MTTGLLAPNDWLAHPELLPPRPRTFVEEKYTRLYAVDIQGRHLNDQYVYIAPNGVAVVGLAPSHPLIAAHRQATGYKPLPLQYIPPRLEHLSVEELAAPAAAGEEDEEGGAAGAAASGAAQDEAGAAAGGAAEEAEALGDEGEGDAAGEVAAADAGASGRGEAAGTAAAPAGGGGGGGGPAGGQPSARPLPKPFPLSQCARVDFESGAARHRTGTKLSGKRKQRGAGLGGGAVLARVEPKGAGPGDSFPITAVCGGQLLELNERLSTQSQLLYERPTREGFVAAFFPSPEAVRQLKGRLLDEQAYLALRGLTAEQLL